MLIRTQQFMNFPNQQNNPPQVLVPYGVQTIFFDNLAYKLQLLNITLMHLPQYIYLYQETVSNLPSPVKV
jgi:hypothetical protein